MLALKQAVRFGLYIDTLGVRMYNMTAIIDSIGKKIVKSQKVLPTKAKIDYIALGAFMMGNPDEVVHFKINKKKILKQLKQGFAAHNKVDIYRVKLLYNGQLIGDDMTVFLFHV